MCNFLIKVGEIFLSQSLWLSIKNHAQKQKIICNDTDLPMVSMNVITSLIVTSVINSITGIFLIHLLYYSVLLPGHLSNLYTYSYRASFLNILHVDQDRDIPQIFS